MICYSESFANGDKLALNTVSNDLTQVSVPAENGSQQPSTIINALKGPALMCPLMPISDLHFRAHFKSYKLLTNNKESILSPNSSIKTRNNQNNLHKNKIPSLD
jgi:hypothetical protein